MIEPVEGARKAFEEKFGAEPEVVAVAPGRVNIIGEHTDYNEGFVLPCAVDRVVCVAGSCRADEVVEAVAFVLGEEGRFSLSELSPGGQGGFLAYIAGVLWAAREKGLKVGGLNLVIAGDVPIGGGLSSSAALEVAVATAAKALFGWDIDPKELALMCQRAENEYVGMRCGIMDQMTAVAGEEGHAVLLDCRSLEVELIPVPERLVLVVADTRVRRDLVSSEYNIRRSQCEEAAKLLADLLGKEVRALRDVSVEEWEGVKGRMPELLRRRAEHVITENERVLRAVEALKEGNLPRLGVLMNESHESLRAKYEVSCEELDALVRIARSVDGVYGARLVGAGFGGCIIAAARPEAVDPLKAALEEGYYRPRGLEPAVYAVRPSAGARVLSARGRKRKC